MDSIKRGVKTVAHNTVIHFFGNQTVANNFGRGFEVVYLFQSTSVLSEQVWPSDVAPPRSTPNMGSDRIPAAPGRALVTPPVSQWAVARARFSQLTSSVREREREGEREREPGRRSKIWRAYMTC